MDELQDLRRDIDAIDRELVELFRRRMDVTRRVGEYKRERDMPVLDQARERQVLQNKGELAGEELPCPGGSSGTCWARAPATPASCAGGRPGTASACPWTPPVWSTRGCPGPTASRRR